MLTMYGLLHVPDLLLILAPCTLEDLLLDDLGDMTV